MKYVGTLDCVQLTCIMKLMQCRNGSDFDESQPGVEPAIEKAWQGGVANITSIGRNSGGGPADSDDTSCGSRKGSVIAPRLSCAGY